MIAVTTTYLPRGLLGLQALDRLEADLGLGAAVRLELVVAEAEVAGDVEDRARGDGLGDLEVGREAHAGLLWLLAVWTGSGMAPASAGGSGRRRRRGGRDAVGLGMAARTRWVRRRALVSGPTPPGTGVMADATGAPTRSRRRRRSCPSTTLIPTSTTTAPGLSIAPVTRPGLAGGDDHDVGVLRCAPRGRGSASGRRSRWRARAGAGTRPACRPRSSARRPPPPRRRSDAGPLEDLDRRHGRSPAGTLVARAAGGRRSADGSRRCPWPGRSCRSRPRRPMPRRERHLDDDPGDGRVGVERPSDAASGGGRTVASSPGTPPGGLRSRPRRRP